MLSVVGDGPGSSGKRGDEFTQGQVGSFNKGCLHQAAEGERLQAGTDEFAGAEENDAVEEGDAPALPTRVREPVVFASMGRIVPEAEISRDGRRCGWRRRCRRLRKGRS